MKNRLLFITLFLFYNINLFSKDRVEDVAKTITYPLTSERDRTSVNSSDLDRYNEYKDPLSNLKRSLQFNIENIVKNRYEQNNSDDKIAKFNSIKMSDTTPPQLNSITISPDPVNSGETITVTVNATDDVSGLASIYMYMLNPEGSQGKDISIDSYNWTDLGNDSYSYNVEISEWAVGGEWYIGYLELRDIAGNSYTQDNNDGDIARFTVNASTPDGTPPQLNSITISPDPVNSGETITVTVNATDDASGLALIYMHMLNSEGSQSKEISMDSYSWTDLGNDSYSYDVEISEWAVGGEWYIDYLELRDIAGNSYTQDNNDGDIATFTVNASTPDGTPPQLNSITISPDPVNSGETITVTVNTTDDVSGLETIYVYIYNSEGTYVETIGGYITEWEDLGNDSYSYDMDISEWAVGGEWYIDYLELRDIAGNLYTQDNNDGDIAVFTVNASTLDGTPPQLNSITISPEVVNNGETITVTVNATDDISGLTSISMSIVNSDGSQTDYIFMDSYSWTDLGNDSYSYDVEISEWAVGGEWYIDYLELRDIAGNLYYKDSYDGDIAVFTVNASTPDGTPPQLNSITISPDPVNSGETITVTANVTDDVSGVASIYMHMLNTDSSKNIYMERDNWTDLGNDSYSYDVDISEWAIGGEWYIGYLELRDIADNSYTQDSYDEEIATFTVNASTPDTTAPQLNSITISPDPVNSGETVTVTLNTTDDLSGVDYIQMTLTSPNKEQNYYIYDDEGYTMQYLGNDNYSFDVPISQWAVNGEWYVSNLHIVDNEGNGNYKYSSEGEIATFTVDSTTPDANAPELHSIVVSPDTINAGETVTITVNITDDVSGIKDIDITIFSPDRYQYYEIYNDNGIEAWKDLGNNTYSYDLEVSEWVVGGEWYIDFLELEDNAGNSYYEQRFDKDTTTFMVNGATTPDTTDPELESVSISPDPVNIGDMITVNVKATDDLSGIGYIEVEILDADEDKEYYVEGEIEDWTSLGDNTYSYDLLIPASAVLGEWHVSEVYLKDNATNSNYFDSNSNNKIATFTVNEDTVSVQDEEIKTPVVYPNPSKTGVFLLSDMSDVEKISVYDLLGREIPLSSSNTIDLSTEPKGIYILKIKKGSYSSTQKLLSK